MFKATTVQSLIESKFTLRQTPTGWFVAKCPLCNDYKERFGIRFDAEAGLQKITTNCWNCSTATKYEEFSGKMSQKFKEILIAGGIDEAEISATVNSAFFNKQDRDDKVITLEKLNKINTFTPPINLPVGALQLGSPEHSVYQQKLFTYLNERSVNLQRYRFFFSLEERFLNRVIIPFYRGGKLIYWQARSIDPGEKKRYDNAPVSRDAVMFNIDQLSSYHERPLFVTEGVFDSMMVDGVSLLGSKLNPAKSEILSKSRRRLVFVVDKDKNGGHLAQAVLANGWDIAFAPAGARDLNESVCRFGLSWTIYELIRSIPKSKDRAELSIKMQCR